MRKISALLLATLLLFHAPTSPRRINSLPEAIHYDKTQFIGRVIAPQWIVGENLAFVRILDHSTALMEFPDTFLLRQHVGYWLKITIENPLNEPIQQPYLATPLPSYDPIKILAVEESNIVGIHIKALYEDHLTARVVYDDPPFHGANSQISRHERISPEILTFRAGEYVDFYYTEKQSISGTLKVFEGTSDLFQNYLCYDTIDGVHYIQYCDGGGWGCPPPPHRKGALPIFAVPITMLLCGILCAHLARDKGYPTRKYFFIGLTLNFIGILYTATRPENNA